MKLIYFIKQIYFENEICLVIYNKFERSEDIEDGRRLEGNVRILCGR